VKTATFRLIKDGNCTAPRMAVVSAASVASVAESGKEQGVFFPSDEPRPEWCGDESDARTSAYNAWYARHHRDTETCEIRTWGAVLQVAGTLDEVCAKLGWTT